MQIDSQDLVSIVVVSYNSAAYIVETLGSIFNQSYSPLELIISDDCSTDNTIALCKEWLATHKKRFSNVMLLESAQNTGISANLNKGEAKATGRWVKPIAADDLLVPDALANYVNYMVAHPEITYLFGKVTIFGKSPEAVSSFRNLQKYNFFNLSAQEQYHSIMSEFCYIPAPSFIYDRLKNNEFGIINDESIPMIEDVPKWINILKMGEKLFLIDKVTVYYRVSTHSVSHTESPIYRSTFVPSSCKLWIKYLFKYQLRLHPRLTIIKYIKIRQYLTNKKIWFTLESIGRVIDPVYRKIRHCQHCDWDDHNV